MMDNELRSTNAFL